MEYQEFERDRNWDDYDIKDLMSRNLGPLDFPILSKLECLLPKHLPEKDNITDKE